MSSIDDDATVTQLAHAWVGVALGGAKVQEASYIYQELGDKFTWTVRDVFAVAGLVQQCKGLAGGGEAGSVLGS
jgi:hypothetical protein